VLLATAGRIDIEQSEGFGLDVGEELGQLFGRQRQRVPPPLVALGQRVAQPPVPGKLLPSHQLIHRDVQGDAAQNVDRLPLFGVDQP
jgi:hypothetical protein